MKHAIYTSVGFDISARFFFPRFVDRTAAIAKFTMEAYSAACIPVMKDALKPPESFTVLMKTWKASCWGMDDEATVIATTKLPSMPTFCNVLSRPETLP